MGLMATDAHTQTANSVHVAKRIFAAAAIMIVFGLTTYVGANLLLFENLKNRLWFGPADQTMTTAINAVSRWTNTNVVEMPARSFILEIILAETPRDNLAIEGALDNIAAVAPTSSATWYALAEVRKARGAPMENVLSAFRMSALTGSHEGYFMMERASFGLNHWSELPEEDRRIVVRDLLGSLVHSPVAPESRYRKILAAKSQAERENIRAALWASGRASKDILQALGV